MDFQLQIADAIRPTIHHYSSDYQEFKALQYAMFLAVFINVLGGFLFIVTAWYLVDDKAKVDQAVNSNVTDESVSQSDWLILWYRHPSFQYIIIFGLIVLHDISLS